jgi:hypothetical protein
MFSGEKGQDVVSWLRTVEDYLEFVSCTERQAVAYMICLLSGHARIWWDAEFLSRGNTRPATVEEFKMLLRAQFESPIRETRARIELLNLSQRKGENAVTYMSRTKSLLHKVPGYDMKMVLQQWILGLRQPYRLEAAKAAPKTLAEAEHLVARLEEAIEFSKCGKDEGSSTKKDNGGDQAGNKKGKQNAGNSGGTGKKFQGQSSGNKGQAAGQQTTYARGQDSNRGRGQAGPSRPPQQSGSNYHPGRQSGGSGQRGRGRGRGKPRVAVMATSDELRRMADLMDREAEQHAAVSEDASQQNRQGN